MSVLHCPIPLPEPIPCEVCHDDTLSCDTTSCPGWGCPDCDPEGWDEETGEYTCKECRDASNR
jgi:hypothetical protein